MNTPDLETMRIQFIALGWSATSLSVVIECHPLTYAVRCSECGATGLRMESDDPKHAVTAWNQRQGRMSVVK